jgi:hypothetical protein
MRHHVLSRTILCLILAGCLSGPGPEPERSAANFERAIRLLDAGG